jgi:hypothetical protein
MLKVDSRPGRLNIELLAELCLLGFYLYPGVPNMTAVSQETDQTTVLSRLNTERIYLADITKK